jgi:cyclic-di-AMP phosphodiesterase PgpH
MKTFLLRLRDSITPRTGNAPSQSASAHLPPMNLPKAGLVLATIALLSALISIHLTPDKISLRLGDRSPREIRASRSVIYNDTAQTALQRQVAAATLRPIYASDPTAAASAGRTVQELFEQILAERASSARAGTVKFSVTTLQAQWGNAFNAQQITRLLKAPQASLLRLRDVSQRLTQEAMARDIRDLADIGNPADDLKYARQTVVSRAQDTLGSAPDAAIVGIVVGQALRPNLMLDRARTEAERQEAVARVAPVQSVITPGDKIIGAGEEVTQAHLDKFLALGLLNPRLELTTGAAVCILAAAMVVFVALYIHRMLPALYANTRRLALLSVIVLLSVFGLKVGATMLGLQFSNGQLVYLGMMSVTAAGMLVTVMLDRGLAVLVVSLLAMLSGLIMNHEIRFAVMTLMSSLVGILAVSPGRSRNSLFHVTLSLSVVNVGLVWLLGMLWGNTLQELQNGTLWAVCASGFATFLFWFGVTMLERPFGILTHTGLLELSTFDRPLLRQLCAVAPGTYAHSMMVGTLAESAAQAIGADALLCRVAGYYHDIGKMKRPDFFVENQQGANIHGRLSPSLSALIITAHVRDGVDMAKENRLPTEIRDIIEQHHGTTLIRYFYHRALADCETAGEIPPGLEERFRYPGPKPRTREAAIVMLADSIEAAARSMDKPSQERLEALIQSIIRDKGDDGQLDDCPLTFHDLREVGKAFAHVLAAMMHERISYPSMEPRTATGKPMEVVRPDLRPQPPALELPFTLSHTETQAVGLLERELPVTETEREMAAHLSGVEETNGCVAAERVPEASENRGTAASGASSAPVRRGFRRGSQRPADR